MLSVKTFTFNPVQENTYVLYNEAGQCCIIDPGCYFQQERDELKNFIEQTGLQPILLLNTHCHLDHVFGNKWVAKTWGLVLHIHEKEKRVLDFAPQSAEMWQLPFDNYMGELVYIKEGTNISVGPDELGIRFTPGHSPGSVVFFNKELRFAHVGDVLFNGSVGRTDLPGGSHATLISSIKEKLLPLGDDVGFICGHGAGSSIGQERMTNPFLTGEM
jgi:glyoxylase-like metal-dependent hydrolase (beta-lactamase superfamily II)